MFYARSKTFIFLFITLQCSLCLCFLFLTRASVSHLYGPFSLNKWPSLEEETAVAAQEEEEKELLSSGPVHALLLHPWQQQ